MTQAIDTPSVPTAATLTHRTARGFTWLLIDAAGSKVVNLLGQMALARLLLPEHWGLVGLAYTVSVFPDLIASSGVKEVLIQRHARFERWSNAAVWMSMALGLLGAAVMLAAAPLARAFYDAPQLTALVAILAAATPLNSLGNVPEALLRSQLRFRALSILSLSRGVGITVLTVILAALGFGAYSFMVPRPIVALAHTAAVWYLARPPVQWNPQLKRWRYIFSDTGVMLASMCVVMVISYGAYIVLGRFHDEETVGYYYFAYNLSTQAVVVFGLNLANVLLPALSHLQHDRPRQLRAFVRAARMLGLIGIPLCIVQGVVAGPVIRLLFGERMEPCVPILAILSFGMAYHVLWNASRSLLLSQGGFRAFFVRVSAYAAIYMIATTAAALIGAAVAVAVATAAFYIALMPIDTYLAIRGSGGTWRDVARIYGTPTVLSAVSIAPFALLIWSWPVNPIRDGVLLAAIPGFSILIYMLLARVVDRETCAELIERIRAATRRRN